MRSQLRAAQYLAGSIGVVDGRRVQVRQGLRAGPIGGVHRAVPQLRPRRRLRAARAGGGPRGRLRGAFSHGASAEKRASNGLPAMRTPYSCSQSLAWTLMTENATNCRMQDASMQYCGGVLPVFEVFSAAGSMPARCRVPAAATAGHCPSRDLAAGTDTGTPPNPAQRGGFEKPESSPLRRKHNASLIRRTNTFCNGLLHCTRGRLTRILSLAGCACVQSVAAFGGRVEVRIGTWVRVWDRVRDRVR